MLLTLSLVFTIALFVPLVENARILCIYPTPFYSHQIVFNRLTEALADGGHELVVLAPVSNKNKLRNVTIIDVTDISTKKLSKELAKIKKREKSNETRFSLDPMTFWANFYEALYSVLEEQMKTTAMENIMKDANEKFDIILIEASIRPALMVTVRFKAPVVLVSSFYGTADNYYTAGAAIDPIIFPEFDIQQSTNLPLWNKLWSAYTSLKLRMQNRQIEEVENRMIREYFGEDSPTIAELRKNVAMLLLNVHHVWDYNRPVPPNVIYLGALQLKDPKPLPNDLKQYLDDSKHGVVYMSLGSHIRSVDLPKKTRNLIFKVFSELPYDFLWKWELQETQGSVPNVRFEKWTPQNDLLHHPKMKAFITHAGLQSTDEAIAARVPLIGLPIRSDQPSNAAKYEDHGIGIRLDIENLNEDELKKAILDVAENPKYRENIDKLALIMKEQRVGSLDKALRWIEHIARHGGEQLRTPLPDLTFVQYYMLDVIGFIALLVLASAIVLIFIIKYVFKLLYQMNKVQKLKLS